MTLPDIVRFLRARYDKDERVALAAPRYAWTIYLAGDPETEERTEQRVLDHVIRHDPSRVLREVEAKRRILDECEGQVRFDIHGVPILRTDGDESLLLVLRLLALPYADHPDYREEWRP